MEEVYILYSEYYNIGQEWHEEKVLGIFKTNDDANIAMDIAEKNEPSWSQGSGRYFEYHVVNATLYTDVSLFSIKSKKNNHPED